MPGRRLTRTPPAPPVPPHGTTPAASGQSASQSAGSLPGDGTPGPSSRTAGAASLNLEGCSHSVIGAGPSSVTARAVGPAAQAGPPAGARPARQGTTLTPPHPRSPSPQLPPAVN